MSNKSNSSTTYTVIGMSFLPLGIVFLQTLDMPAVGVMWLIIALAFLVAGVTKSRNSNNDDPVH